MKYFSKIAVLSIFATIVLFSCNKKRTCNDDVPVITFDTLIFKDDNTAKLIINFKDCNGDIGLAQSDTATPYKFNFFMEYFELQNGNWVQLAPLIPFYYRIPIHSKTGDFVEGDLEIDNIIYYNPTSLYDTSRFEIYIQDYALNKSNTVVSSLIVRPAN